MLFKGVNLNLSDLSPDFYKFIKVYTFLSELLDFNESEMRIKKIFLIKKSSSSDYLDSLYKRKPENLD